MTLLLALFPACLTLVQGNGQTTTETRSLDEFDAIDVAGELPVEVRPGAAPGMTLTCDSNLLPYIHAEVEEGRLVIEERGERGWVQLRPEGPCRIEVEATRLRSIELSGSASVEIQEDSSGQLPSLSEISSLSISGSGQLRLHPAQQVEQLKVELSGSGWLRVDQVQAERVQASLSGSGEARLEGEAEKLLAGISGSGELMARSLHVERAEVNVSGSGSAEVWASESVEVQISGSGDVEVWGSPEERQRSISGSGELRVHD